MNGFETDLVFNYMKLYFNSNLDCENRVELIQQYYELL